MWPGLEGHWRTRATSPAVAFDQGRVMGGGSSVMGMVALRGTQDDYAEWERLGARGWSWKDVLPYFRRLESDLDFAGDAHGDSGPIPIRRVGLDSLTDDERDLRRMMHGFRWVVDFLSSEAVRPLCGRPFPVRFTDCLRRLNRLGSANAVRSAVIGALLDVHSGLSDYALQALTGGAVELYALTAEDDLLAEHVRRNVAGTTCAGRAAWARRTTATRW